MQKELTLISSMSTYGTSLHYQSRYSLREYLRLEERLKVKSLLKNTLLQAHMLGISKSLLNELSLKRSFKPDIIFIDYLNICASSRYKGHIVNSYTYVKAIAEELRGLACEHDVPIVSATQTTRNGFGNSDVEPY